MTPQLTRPNLTEHLCRLITRGVADVFKTMFGLEAVEAAAAEPRASNEPLVAGSVGFIGDVNGVVYLEVTDAFARTLASRMLGLAEAELDGEEMVNDVIGELSNMVVGGVKSQLCDSGAPCVLTIPSVVRGQRLSLEPLRSSERRLLHFRCAEDDLIVELIVKQAP
jgi:chemotaxis protein CheX